MKKLVALISFLAFCSLANAQYHYPDASNPEMLMHSDRHEACRTEIILPNVNDHMVLKADLHNHTAYSDGQVLPNYRVREAWLDGLDVIAATDHIEYRPNDAVFYEYLKGYTNTPYVKTLDALKSGDTTIDLNFVVRQYEKEAPKYGILIIPGSEITRNGTTVGHFNALFTTDNNLIYDVDPVKAIRNAKAQGALVMHNHPGWRKSSIDFTDAEKQAYEEGLIDGVEVMNGIEFYPGIIDRVEEYGLFISANTDVHGSTANDYRLSGHMRPMTLILAKERTLESIREALEAKRTIAWGFDNLCGNEQLLKDFFMASIKVSTLPNGSIQLTNMTSIPYIIKQDGKNHVRLEKFASIILNAEKETGILRFTLLNVWTGKDSHLNIEIPTI